MLEAIPGSHKKNLRANLNRLVQARILFQRGFSPNESYTFKHALIQDSAYLSLLKSHRRNYHKQIAETIEEKFSELVSPVATRGPSAALYRSLTESQSGSVLANGRCQGAATLGERGGNFPSSARPCARRTISRGNFGTGAFDWDSLVDIYYRANIDPSDRYVLSVSGSTSSRLTGYKSGFSNLYLAGDWTVNGLNAGCVEAATMSGKIIGNVLREIRR
ncbi:MAG: hypothetical protein WBL39_11005 [Terrimicrobiaceae bacterium]